MRFLVDSSVWSLALRRRRPSPTYETELLRAAISDDRVEIIGAIRQEILSGIREDAQFERLMKQLAAFPDEPLTNIDYIEAARICNLCSAKGIAAGNTDCLIAAVAKSRDWEVITTDQDFSYMARVVDFPLHIKN